MLTIDFKVNGACVMVLHVHNRGRAFPEMGRAGEHVYAYAWAIERKPGLEVEPERLTGRLVHDRRDSAVALAAKILEQAGLQHPAPAASDPS